MRYEAIVCRLHNVRVHPNADRLKLATAHGHQVVVGLDHSEGELGLFFGPDGQLSEEYANANDLVSYSDPVTGEKKGGYFAKNRRVRSQKFRGEKSEGYFATIDSLSFTGSPLLVTEGETFSEFGGVPICNKYFTPATLRAMKGGTKATKKVNICFAEHVDTEKFKYYPINSISEDAILYFTEKVHGTSGRYGYVLEEEKLKRTLRDRILRRTRVATSYRYLNGTRRTTLVDGAEGYYGDESFRRNATKGIELHKGEVLYFELVGYTTTGATIMADQDTTKLKDKEISKRYGKLMRYSYGCEPGQTRMFIYRITRVNEDGVAIDLSWPQVKQRAAELGLEVVPELSPPVVMGELLQPDLYVEQLTEGVSILDSSHIREGVVVRIESSNGTEFVKNKSFVFGLLEGYLKEADDYVDLEEAS